MQISLIAGASDTIDPTVTQPLLADSALSFAVAPVLFQAFPADAPLPLGGPADILVADPMPAPSDAPLVSDPIPGPSPDIDALGIRYPALSGDARIDGVLLGRAWNALSITYSFPDSSYDYEYPYGLYNEPWSSGAAQAWPAQRPIFRAIFEGQPGGASVMRYGSIESFSGLDFTDYGANSADIRIAITPYANPTAYAYYPAEAGYGGDIWFGYSTAFQNPVLGDWGYLAHLHETIHALGLKGGHEAGPLGTPALPYQWDSLEFTVGTYRSFVGAPTDGYRNETYGYPQTLMMLDIAALQYLYGADWGTNAGSTTYRWDPATGEMSVDGVAQGRPGANRVFLTIWDGGGRDTYDMSNYATGVSIDLTPGGWSVTAQGQRARLNDYDGYALAQGCVYNALQVGGSAQSLIEDAIGSGGADSIRGNQAANSILGGWSDDTIDGGAGNDTLNGGTGSDSMVGGAGDDLFIVGAVSDIVMEGPGGGHDRVFAAASFTLPAEVEDIVLVGTAPNANGNAIANVMTGNALANRLAGGAGNDTLYGALGNDTLDGGLGSDSMAGGMGDDRYIVGATTDQVFEQGGGGRDRIVAGVSLIIAAQVEELELTGAAALSGFGNALANVMIGNGAANRLNGGDGNDTATGGGGNDTLDGGLGGDSLSGGDGNDLLQGGDGLDALAGGTGADHFRFAAPTLGWDRIADFTPDADVIEVSRAGFGILLPLGPLADARFSDTGFAVGAVPQFIHVPATGVLRWDVDGAGGAASVPIAVLTGAPVISATDIVVIA